VEIASKGGNYMLNVGPTAEGLIPDESVARLRAVGDWMDRSGEAIYGTTRWRTTHEGPTSVEMEGTREREEKGFAARFTPRDIWYTSKGATLYAIALVAPDDGRVVLASLAADAPEQVKGVRVLGPGAPVPWERDASGLKILLPPGSAGEHGYALAIEVE
jgi:alpha-L-fucosidase